MSAKPAPDRKVLPARDAADEPVERGFGEDTQTFSGDGTDWSRVEAHDYYLPEDHALPPGPSQPPSSARSIRCLGCEQPFDSQNPKTHRFCKRCKVKQASGIALTSHVQPHYSPLHVDESDLSHALHVDPEDEAPADEDYSVARRR